MTDNELIFLAYKSLFESRHNKQGAFAEQVEDTMAALDYRIKNPPRLISGQTLIDAIIAHEEENNGRFHLSTYSFVRGIRFTERRMGVTVE